MRKLLKITALVLVFLTAVQAVAQRRPKPIPEPSIRRIEIERQAQRLSQARHVMHLSQVYDDAPQQFATFTKDFYADEPSAQITRWGPDEFAHHLQGVAERVRVPAAQSEGLREELRAIYKLQPSERPAAYAKLIARRRQDARIASLDTLSAYERGLLHNFIVLTHGEAPVDRALEIQFIADFHRHQRDVYRKLAREEFLLLRPGETRELADSLNAQFFDYETAHRYNALTDYIKRTPTLAELKVNEWRVRAADEQAIATIADKLMEPIPGGEPEVLFFLDPLRARGATAEMAAALKDAGRAAPKFLDHNDLSQLMSGLSGRTVLLIGHIEASALVLDRGPGQPPLAIDLAAATNAALSYGTLLIPIGCESARAGAFYGFQRPITTSQVASYLRGIPRGPLAIGDLLRGLSRLGPVTVEVDQLRRVLDIVVREDIDTDEAPILTLRIQLQAVPGSGFSAYQTQWNQTNLWFFDRGGLSWIGRVYRTSEGMIPLIVSALLLMVAALMKYWQQARAHLRAWAKTIRILRGAILAGGIIMLLTCILQVNFILWLLTASFLLHAYEWLARMGRPSPGGPPWQTAP